MAMLIAWQTLNKVQSPRDARFSNRFLIVAPGITIKDRLRVLLPEDEENAGVSFHAPPTPVRLANAV